MAKNEQSLSLYLSDANSSQFFFPLKQTYVAFGSNKIVFINLLRYVSEKVF